MAGNQFMAMEGIKLGQLSGILNPKEKWPLKLEAQAVDLSALQKIDAKISLHVDQIITRKFRCQEKGRSGQQNQKSIQQTQRIDSA